MFSPLLLFLLLWMPPAAVAHSPSDSYLNLRFEGSRITGTWDMALRDLDGPVAIDANGDGQVTWGELKSREPEINRYATNRLQIKVNGINAPIRFTGRSVTNYFDGPYLALEFECRDLPEPRFLVVDYRAFFDVNPRHRGLLRLEHDGRTLAAIFNLDEPSQVFELARPDRWAQWIAFTWEGVWHIWIGFDHILFLIALLLPSVLEREAGGWRVVANLRAASINVLKIVTAFTVAHSLTLGLATFGVVRLPARWVESVIAASVVLAALHNFFPVLKGKSWPMAFGFGLIHGFGFATVLAELGLERGTLALALISFNVGVELGQLAIVSVFLPLAYAFRGTRTYQNFVLRLGSAFIVVLAAVWMVERLFDVRLLRF
jgi:hypothetical protein